MLALTLATTIHIGVLGTHHPVEVDVRPASPTALTVETRGKTQVIQGTESIHLDGPARITGPKGSFVRMAICLPNGVTREYYGRLEVRRHYYELQLIVEMDRELAVASILAAEGAAALPPEALRAQAIVVRSYMLAATDRHAGFDMCDTTHCQQFGPPPAPNSVAMKAALATRGQVLTYRGNIVPAMYSANCGGRTRTLAEAGWQPGEYPFFAVDCPLKGAVSGHRIGMCQTGAAELARRGFSFQEIVDRYFPATAIEAVEK